MNNSEFQFNEENVEKAEERVHHSHSSHHHHHSHHHSSHRSSHSSKEKKESKFGRIIRQNMPEKKKKVKLKKSFYEKLSKKDRKRFVLSMASLGVVVIALLIVFLPRLFHTHDFGEWKTKEEATCTMDGYQIAYCKSCGADKTRNIPASHNFVLIVDENTHENFYKCSICGETSTTDPTTNSETEGLPLYYLSAIASIEEDILDFATDKSVVFAHITDVHYDQSAHEETRDRQLLALRKLCDDGVLDFAVLGGDLSTGSSKDTASSIITNTLDTLSNSKTPVLVVKGDHDVNNHYPETYYQNEAGDAQISVSEWSDLVDPYMPGIVKPTGVTITESSVNWQEQKARLQNSNYYYYDVPGKKVRVVHFDTGTYSSVTYNGVTYASNGYVQPRAVYRWLTGEVFTNEVKDGWEFIVLTHSPLDSHYVTGTTSSNLANFNEYCTALNNREKWQYNMSLGDNNGTCTQTADFTDWTSKVRVYCSGHLHSDRLDIVEESDIAVCTTGSAAMKSKEKETYLSQYPGRNSWLSLAQIGVSMPPEREKDTITEALFDIFILKDDSIVRLRFGAGAAYTAELFNKPFSAS